MSPVWLPCVRFPGSSLYLPLFWISWATLSEFPIVLVQLSSSGVRQSSLLSPLKLFIDKELLSFMKVKSESEFDQSYPTLCDPMDYSLPGSSLHGILQARVLEWIAISFSKGSSRPRDRTRVSRVPGRCFNLWATREAPSFMRPSWMEESPWCLEVYRFMGRQTD